MPHVSLGRGEEVEQCPSWLIPLLSILTRLSPMVFTHLVSPIWSHPPGVTHLVFPTWFHPPRLAPTSLLPIFTSTTSSPIWSHYLPLSIQELSGFPKGHCGPNEAKCQSRAAKTGLWGPSWGCQVAGFWTRGCSVEVIAAVASSLSFPRVPAVGYHPLPEEVSIFVLGRLLPLWGSIQQRLQETGIYSTLYDFSRLVARREIPCWISDI